MHLSLETAKQRKTLCAKGKPRLSADEGIFLRDILSHGKTPHIHVRRPTGLLAFGGTVGSSEAKGYGNSVLRQPPIGSSGPPSHSQRVIHAHTNASRTVSGAPTRRKSAKRYCPGPRISRLPWWPIGVRNATTAPSAVQTTKGVAGMPSESASATAIGPSSTVVAESERIWVSSAADVNIASRIGSAG